MSARRPSLTTSHHAPLIRARERHNVVTEHGVVVARSDRVASPLRSRLTHRRPWPAREDADAGGGSGADVDDVPPGHDRHRLRGRLPQRSGFEFRRRKTIWGWDILALKRDQP